jgi:hypothetical protein
MIAYIDEHKDRFGIEPICEVLPIAPSTYYDVFSRFIVGWQVSRSLRTDLALDALEMRSGVARASSKASSTTAIEAARPGSRSRRNTALSARL